MKNNGSIHNKRNRELKQMEVFLVAAVFILITAIILIIHTMQREQEFNAHNTDFQKAIVHGAAYAVDQHLQSKNKSLRLFLDEYSAQVFRLNRFPGDERAADDIKVRLQQRFDDFFTFTITDKMGEPSLTDIDSLVGEACRIDLHNYSRTVTRDSKQVKNEVFIHPQPYNYHYDIMAPVYEHGKEPRIFFSSFYLKKIVDILRTHEVPGHNLMLVRQSKPEVIEVTREGARDVLTRERELSKEELKRITVYENIQGSDWRL
ncbi:MAG: Unknown protein, partial [uncultured Thiotrichaceae bacterium]